MAKLKSRESADAANDIEKVNRSYIAVGNVNAAATLENCLTISFLFLKFNMQPFYESAVALLGVICREMETYVCTRTFT